MPSDDLLAPDTPGGARQDFSHHAPPIFTAPSRGVEWARELVARGSSRFNHHMLPRLNDLARRAYADARLGVMDVEAPMTPRVDGHLDPLHYCLPGPADFYSEVLFNFMLP